jgi:hypothetical protein
VESRDSPVVSLVEGLSRVVPEASVEVEPELVSLPPLSPQPTTHRASKHEIEGKRRMCAAA